MKLEDIKLDDIKNTPGDHRMIIISNGQIKTMELPEYGTIVVESHCKKVKQIKEEVKQLF